CGLRHVELLSWTAVRAPRSGAENSLRKRSDLIAVPRRLSIGQAELALPSIEIVLDAGEHEAEKADLALGQPVERDRVHLHRVGQQARGQGAALLGHEDMDLAAIGRAAPPLDEAAALHVLELLDGCRLHRADALAQLALGEAILLPERAQEIPHADRDLVRRQVRLEILGEAAMGDAHQIADAVLERVVELAFLRFAS